LSNSGSRVCRLSAATSAKTSFERKMRVYLTAQAAKLHEQQFGWKAFRVLTITTDQLRFR
jgi:hypothetical protein